MKKASFQPSFYVNNRKNLIAMLPKNTLALIFSNDEMPRNGDQHFMYRQNSDLFYLSGIIQPNTILALCPDHPNSKYREILFVLKADAVREIWDGHRLTAEETSRISGVETVTDINKFYQTVDDLAFSSENIYMNLIENIKSNNELKTCDFRMINVMKSRFPLHRYGRLAPLTSSLRTVKHGDEIHLIKHACEITGKAFDRVLGAVKAGMHEYEIEAEMTYEIIRNGASGHAFLPIVASGENACVLH